MSTPSDQDTDGPAPLVGRPWPFVGSMFDLRLLMRGLAAWREADEAADAARRSTP